MDQNGFRSLILTTVFSSPMLIGHIYHRFPIFSRTGSYYQEFLEGLVKQSQNLEIVLITARYPRDAQVRLNERVRVLWLRYFDPPVIGWILFEVQVFLRGLFSKRFRSVDLIHVSNLRGLLAGWGLSLVLGKKLVLTVEILNDPQGGLSNRFFYFFQKFLYRFVPVSRIICWSHFFSRVLVEEWGIAPERVLVIPPGIDTTLFNSQVDGTEVRSRYARGKKLIVFAKPLFPGNLGSALLLLESLNLVKNRDRFRILYGDGECRAMLEARVAELGLGEDVDFMPPSVAFAEIPRYLAAADLIVLSFAYPPTVARSFLEALAIGRPVIVTAVGEIPYLVKDQEQVLLVPPEPEKIAAGIEQLDADPDLGSRLVARAISLIRNNYDLESVSGRVTGVYRNVSGGW